MIPKDSAAVSSRSPVLPNGRIDRLSRILQSARRRSANRQPRPAHSARLFLEYPKDAEVGGGPGKQLLQVAHRIRRIHWTGRSAGVYIWGHDGPAANDAHCWPANVMRCVKCHKKEATIHFTPVVDGKPQETVHLCKDCAPDLRAKSIEAIYRRVTPEEFTRLQSNANAVESFFGCIAAEGSGASKYAHR